jgi:hypothetical protein
VTVVPWYSKTLLALTLFGIGMFDPYGCCTLGFKHVDLIEAVWHRHV